ncbi:type 1 fimbrial protein, partial [Salmonella enterica subsp. enterica serovar Enteritidis]|nr:type 1 fimbrial protein [Salmonella enterica subsp. enterica serovar Enteritidis]
AGTALANSDVTAGAATGVGIGIFDEANAPVKINSDTLLASQADKFKLQMVKLDGQTPVAGSVLGSLTVQIERM